MILSGCATQAVEQIQHPFLAAKHRTIRIERCIDRSGFKGERDLAEEATRALTDKIMATNRFEAASDPSLVVTCDIEGFAEGSAFQRWLLPGWGASEAKVAVVVWEKPDDKVLATFRSHSSVSSGGLYTIGADQYILTVAIDDVVNQLQAWAKGGKAKEDQP